MKYYSEVTGEIFDTIEELEKSEEKILKENLEKEKAEKEISEAYHMVVEAWKYYLEVCKKHGKKDIYIPSSSLWDDLMDFVLK